MTAQPQTVHSTPAQPPVRYVPAGQTVVPQYQAPLPGGYAVAPKNPALSLIAALFIPGLGSMINGDVGKGVAILIGYGIAWLFTFILIGIPFLFGFWIWGMVDGYQGRSDGTPGTGSSADALTIKAPDQPRALPHHCR